MKPELQRPPSWAQPEDKPPAGAWCSCCHGQRWWRERENPKGWRCMQCHPSHEPRAIIEVITGKALPWLT